MNSQTNNISSKIKGNEPPFSDIPEISLLTSKLHQKNMPAISSNL
jgi:hypothetical protein